MNPIQTKICGITRVEDAIAAQEAGADAIGLNFYAKSKRYIDPESAVTIADSVRDQMSIVGVFVNSSIDGICETSKRTGLSHVQLHGDESPETVAGLRHRISGVSIIRAIRMVDNDVAAAQVEIARWQAVGADVVLLDAASLDAFGGTGKQLDWTKLNQLAFEVPWLLAGGLDPDNVADAIRLARPDGVDVASGVETEPGIKDQQMVRKFVDEAAIGRRSSD